MLQPVVIDGIRTPIGKLNGAMKDKDSICVL